MARYIAKSSRSKALYFCSAGRSLRLKNATGFHEPRSCSRTAPIAVPDASTVSAVGLSARGCTSIVALARASLAALKASSRSLNHSKLTGLPANAA